MWGRAQWARRQLRQRLVEDAQVELIDKDHGELLRLPVQAREAIRTWFHAPCLNAAEFVYEVCSPAFSEKLSACATEDLRELCFLNAFVSKVVSEVEILNRIHIIAEEIGSELDRNWAACCQKVGTKWNARIQSQDAGMPADFGERMEPLVRQSLDEAIQRATVAGQRPALGETAGNIGKAALLVLPVVTLPQIAIPLFALLAMRHLFAYVMGQLTHQVGDYQRAISDRLALLGNRIGVEFETEIRTRIAHLHEWQDQAVQATAAIQASEAISLF
jgi:hypothetical protein